MCGITGIAYFDSEREVSKNELLKMMDVIKHRGPDDEGTYLEKNIGLGFRRLSIIDLNTGHQPLANEDASTWITFNGEIYNYKELRTLLIQKGHIFTTETDTEVIVHLYEEYGKDCFKYLRGMFGLVIWDSVRRVLTCARDRFGIKPFFYCFDSVSFSWGSEIKAITTQSEKTDMIDPTTIDYYFTYGYSPKDRTIFKSIKKLEPASVLEVDLSNKNKPIYKISKYWELKTHTYIRSVSEWTDSILETLKESIEIHLISDVPLGAFLSGGIDSSAVVALMSKVSGKQIKTFSIGFGDPKFNELPFADSIAQKYITDHNRLVVDPPESDFLQQLVEIYDEPFADSSAIPTLILSEFARRKVTVALSGDGGDELFAGYTDYMKIHSFKKLKNVPPFNFNTLLLFLHRLMPDSMSGKKMMYQLAQHIQHLKAHISIFNEFDRKELFTPGIQKQIDENAESKVERLLNNYNSDTIIGKAQQLDIETFMNDDILVKVDRASMFHSLEVRVPLLDHKLVELAFQMPLELKINNNQLKYIFKKAIRDYLTKNVLDHKKTGFAVPLKKWISNSMHNNVYDKLFDRTNPIYEFLEYNYIRRLYRTYQGSNRNLERQVWSVFMFSQWLNYARQKKIIL